MTDERQDPDEIQVDLAGAAFTLEDFDRYVEEHGIPQEHWPAAFAQWIAEKTGGPVPDFEKVEDPDDDAGPGG